MTMRKHVKGLLLCASVCSLAVGAGMISYASTTTSSSTESSSETHTPPEDDGSVMAKIVSIDGNTLTISTADKPDHNGGQKPADGQTPPEKPADGRIGPYDSQQRTFLRFSFNDEQRTAKRVAFERRKYF